MSTRCQIEFKVINKWKDKKGKVETYTERRTVYRHSDGYPEGVIPDLKEFLKWNSGRNGDIEYMTANFIYWSKRWYEEHFFKNKGKWSAVQNTNISNLHIGFGVCENDQLHGDIEYYYKVIINEKGKIKIEIYKPGSFDCKMEDLKLIKSVKIE